MKNVKIYSSLLAVFLLLFIACSPDADSTDIKVEEKASVSELFAIPGEINNTLYDAEDLRTLLIDQLAKDRLDRVKYEELITVNNIRIVANENGHFMLAEWLDLESKTLHGFLGRLSVIEEEGRLPSIGLIGNSCRSHGCECTSKCDCMDPPNPQSYCEEFENADMGLE